MTGPSSAGSGAKDHEPRSIVRRAMTTCQESLSGGAAGSATDNVSSANARTPHCTGYRHAEGADLRRIRSAQGDVNDLDIPARAIVRIDGYFRLPRPGLISSFQPHKHMRGKAQCM